MDYFLDDKIKKTKKIPLIANHHGDIKNENNLSSTRNIIKNHKEIDIFEIDFVHYKGDFYSSHDYKLDNILNGSTLTKWIDLIIIQNKRILYIDIKTNIDVFSILFFCYPNLRFDVQAFFKHINKIRRYYLKKMNFDIIKYIWIACQDKDTISDINRINDKRVKSKWIIISDIPYYSNYILKTIFSCVCAYNLINKYVVQQPFLSHDFTDDLVVSIDKSCFNSIEELIYFIEMSSIPRGITIVLYTFELNEERIYIKGYNIVMLYNYTQLL